MMLIKIEIFRPTIILMATMNFAITYFWLVTLPTCVVCS